MIRHTPFVRTAAFRTHCRRVAVGAIALVVTAFATASAQLGSFNPLPGPHGSYAIRNAKIVTVSGAEIPQGTVVIGANGRIVAVGANVTVPSDAKTIDGTGLTVYPGMMDAGTSMGLSEIPQGAAGTVDISETGSFNPNAQAMYGLNPHSAHVGVTRVVGITHVASLPNGGIISGQATIVNLAGWTVPEMEVVPRAAVVINLPRSGFAGRGFAAFLAAQQQGSSQDAQRARERQLDSLRQMLRDAEAYGKAIDASEKDKTLPRVNRDVVLAALVPAVRGQMPVIFTADRAADIRAAVTFAKEMKLKPIILGGGDAYQVTSFLKENDVPVIMTGVMSLPRREDDPYDVNYSGPGKIQKAGVRFAISAGDEGAEVRNLPYTAGMASAFGLPKDEALKSVTLYPAQIMGVADKFGSIEVGKVANLVVTDGELLEAKTNTKYLFIDGRPVPLSTKHTELNDLFKDRP
ncbi:MAG TPA: amidohydrolase family protein [Gemmatimonadaceae bacterium]|nr:amidohydrolase family protein [Gemmatimonadaceae bacterium]